MYDDLDGKKGNNPVISAGNLVVRLINQIKNRIRLRSHEHQSWIPPSFMTGSDGLMFVYYWEKDKRVIDWCFQSYPGIAGCST